MNHSFFQQAQLTVLNLLRWVSLACIVAYSTRYAQEINAGGDPWKTADWLINFSSGWVRRGLLGAFWSELPLNGTALLWTLFFFQVTCYLGVWYLLFRQLEGQKTDPLTWLLLVSPTFLFLFPLYDFSGGFRKEILAFLALSMLLYSHEPGLQARSAWMLGGSVLYAIAVFSHEALAFFLPIFVVTVWRLPSTWALPTALRSAATVLLTTAAAGALISAWLVPGNAEQAQRICTDWMQRGLSPSLCSGAIEWLAYDTSRVTTVLRTQWSSYMLIYAPLMLLSMVPLMQAAHTGLDRTLVLGLLFGALPLFVVAADWGRWIHIHATLCTLYLLRFPAPTRRIATSSRSLVAVLLYATLWSVPTCCAQRPGLGLLSLLPGLAPIEP